MFVVYLTILSVTPVFGTECKDDVMTEKLIGKDGENSGHGHTLVILCVISVFSETDGGTPRNTVAGLWAEV